MKKKKRKQNVYAFIDTNVFLDFYRSKNETRLSLLGKLEGVRDRIISTYQVQMEFLKRRQETIVGAVPPNMSVSDLPAVMEDTNVDQAIRKLKGDLKKRTQEVEKRVLQILRNNSGYDPVYKVLHSIFNSPSENVLTRDMPIKNKIKRLAWRRFVLGYPPRKGRDTSIGDAINWEWIVYCASKLKGKFVIVTNDTDYGQAFKNEIFINDALKLEFRERVGRKSIEVTNKLSSALQMLEVPVTQKEITSEVEGLKPFDSVSGDGIASLLRQAKMNDSLSWLGPDMEQILRDQDSYRKMTVNLRKSLGLPPENAD